MANYVKQPLENQSCYIINYQFQRAWEQHFKVKQF